MKECLVEVQFSLDRGLSYKSVIQGMADSIAIDPIRSIVRVDGRDLSARLVDACSQGAFANQSASEIVTAIALRNGLIPQAYPTPGLAGRFYGNGNEEVFLSMYSRNVTEWDVVTDLAQRTGYDAFVQADTLYFQPSAYERSEPVDVYVGHMTDVQLERTLPVVSDAEVAVRSWNSQLQKSFRTDLGQFTGGVASDINASIATTAYQQVVTVPNLRIDDVSGMVGRLVRDLEQRRRCLEFEMPGELQLTARSRIRLADTNTAFDGLYDVESIQRSFSPTTGFRQRVRARSSDSTANMIVGNS